MSPRSKPSVLVVAAHPDDEVLGCGGTIARLSRERDVHIAILGEGITSRYRSRSATAKTELRRLHHQARAVSSHLRARSVQFGGLPDNRFDDVPLLEVVKKVEAWVEHVRPQTIYTHHPGDLNIDHTTTFRAVLTATRPMQGTPVKELYAFEIPSSTEWAFGRIAPVFRPNAFMDISASIHDKTEAMQLYADEVRAFPHPRSTEALQAIARRWGSVVGVNYAEAFELIRSIR
ncbi:MAG: PIG-L family deacetylase [Candidatus Omnitrophota bacterium]|nr:PIG-L family deacetylase [Candidatus Omnitrophota bacterium]